MKYKVRKISGFADYTEEQNVSLSSWLGIIETNYRKYGFSRLIPRPLEDKGLILEKGGIQKQIFGVTRINLSDRNTSFALPFDRTVPLAIWVAMHSGEVVFPYKRYDISYSYRGETPQAGRFQAFFQADIDIIDTGELAITSDAECISTIYHTLLQLGFNSIKINVNDTAFVKKILFLLGIDDANLFKALRIIDKLSRYSKSEFVMEILSICNDDKLLAGKIFEIFSFIGNIDDFVYLIKSLGLNVKPQDFENLTKLFLAINILGVNSASIVFRPGITRGLDYYTGVVFETFVTGFESFGSVASGGRYDDLASTFANRKLPGVGGSIGVTRLFDLACKNKLLTLNSKTEADVFIGYKENSLSLLALDVANKIRKQINSNVDVYSGSDDLSKQLKYASKKGFKRAILVLSNEKTVDRNLVTGEQRDFII